MVSANDWQMRAEAYAFLGNSLLAPMTQTSDVGCDPAFWEAFPDFGNAEVARAAAELAAWARQQAESDIAREKLVERVSVEYTHLFVGPPSPAAPPWETMNRREGATVGFGEPTFQMRALLREAGLELSGENRQYEDHLGIELLYASELCRRAGEDADADDGGTDAEIDAGADGKIDANTPSDLARFLDEHPRGWIDAFARRVEDAAPDGYFARFVALVRAVCNLP
ncbi:MAG: molecular chaperone TorD family protein [Eggerthellaceae bacterium]|nr:molecular chaperone TorD family protein [Eggerthellaceae bacterium]